MVHKPSSRTQCEISHKTLPASKNINPMVTPTEEADENRMNEAGGRKVAATEQKRRMLTNEDGCFRAPRS